MVNKKYKEKGYDKDIAKMHNEGKSVAEIIDYLRDNYYQFISQEDWYMQSLVNMSIDLIKSKAQVKKLKTTTKKATTQNKPTANKATTQNKPTAKISKQKNLNGELIEKPTANPNKKIMTEKVSFNAKSGETIFEGVIELLQGEAITPQKVMQAHNLNPNRWQVVSFTSNCWQAQTKADEDGNPQKMALWQSKISVKPLVLNQPNEKQIEAFFKKLTQKYKPVYSEPVEHQRTDNMLEINVSDLHYGKLAWKGESGENCDYKIAKKRFNYIIDKEIARLKKDPADQILFVWTNDFFNSDTIDNTTTAGTPQSTDLRWAKLFDTGTEALVEAIDRLQVEAPVKTFYIASNHGRQVEYYATKYLQAYFKNNDRVFIDTNGMARHYELYGSNLIGFTHSSFEKHQNLNHLMSVEVPKLWAKSNYREMHLAHIHCEKVEEKGGIIMRWLPSVTGTDQWHYDNGYVGATKRSYSFRWNKNDGLESINVVNINEKPQNHPHTLEQ